MRVNINGLRKEQKRILLGKLTYDIWAGVCVVTETHLKKADLGQLAYDNYRIMADFCRPTPIGERIGRVVVILAHNSLSSEKGRELEAMGPQVARCEIKLCLSSIKTHAVRLSGIYVPPGVPVATKQEKLQATLRPAPEDAPATHRSYIRAGDFIITDWEARYTEWLRGEGIAELTNPENPPLPRAARRTNTC